MKSRYVYLSDEDYMYVPCLRSRYRYLTYVIIGIKYCNFTGAFQFQFVVGQRPRQAHAHAYAYLVKLSSSFKLTLLIQGPSQYNP